MHSGIFIVPDLQKDLVRVIALSLLQTEGGSGK
jgi:hypothetical protein